MMVMIELTMVSEKRDFCKLLKVVKHCIYIELI